MKKMIVLFLVLGVFLAGVVAAVAYLIGYDSNKDGYSVEIDSDGYSVEIDNNEHLYNQLGGYYNDKNKLLHY